MESKKQSKEITDSAVKGTEDADEEQEVAIPLGGYFGIHTVVFVGGVALPSMLMLYYGPLMRLIGLNNLFGLTNSVILGIQDFWIWFFFPLWLLLALFIFILMTAWISELFNKYWHNKSPPEQGLYRRKFSKNDVVDERLKYYHYRGFVIKWPLWLAMKSPFPWMKYWILRYIGHNNVDESAVYIDAFPCLEFSTLKKNAVVMCGGLISSHVVDSLYGNLTIKAISIGENTLLNCNTVMAPGAIVDDNNVFMPHTFAIKDWKSKDKVKFYSNSPARSIEDKYKGIFSVLPEAAKSVYKEKGYITGSKIRELLHKMNEN
ncbi:MAG: hypothetical protein GF364_07605 [Candidatus Lokiarchaeota archaeon]|nr:hypothetical protein [Candidatus Lokiarchaeota archaeon]